MSRLRPPAWLKPLILPAWNQSHRLAWRAGEYLGAIRHGRWGHCEVCGRWGPWLYQPRVIPPRLARLWGLSDRLAAALAHKESDACAWCGSKLRARKIAEAILDRCSGGEERAPSIAAWSRSPSAQRLRVAEINRIEGLHEFLSRIPGLAFSDYDPEAPPGGMVRGVRSEDVASLTYADEAFDLVLSSETLEHVPDLNAACAEIRRVLVPGGRHIFTIPMLPGVPRTYPRMTRGHDGEPQAAGAEIRHPGGDQGYLVWTEFGADLPDLMREAGFEVEVIGGPPTEDDLAQVYVATRPMG